VAYFFQADFELHPYDVEKWAASRWNHRQLKIGRRQLDLWHRLSTYVLQCSVWLGLSIMPEGFCLFDLEIPT
jgi:hypothetical protein